MFVRSMSLMRFREILSHLDDLWQFQYMRARARTPNCNTHVISKLIGMCTMYVKAAQWQRQRQNDGEREKNERWNEWRKQNHFDDVTNLMSTMRSELERNNTKKKQSYENELDNVQNRNDCSLHMYLTADTMSNRDDIVIVDGADNGFTHRLFHPSLSLSLSLILSCSLLCARSHTMRVVRLWAASQVITMPNQYIGTTTAL